MLLEENQIFDGRFRLIKQLGQGASAEVWFAEDCTANNLRVAVKIFTTRHGGMHTEGASDFQKEFTTVYNINHQNLLTPTNFAIHDGVPYLVLPYCENGSVSSMMGRCDEQDILRLLHDVSAGLDHLHRHNVIHQDIKPDNIMLDDDLNHLVSDFGISTGNEKASETFGGTRAYMAPERFSGESTAKGDIWSLGATAYEMLTGNAPFGDHGGLAQAQGEKVPAIDRADISPALKSLIGSMLDFDPEKRPSADKVRRLTERVIETGSWKETTRNKPVKVMTLVLSLALIVGALFAWGMLRTKTYYYADYIEVNGAPVGIGSLFGSQQRQRQYSYRFQTRGGKVTRVSLVNSHGKIVENDYDETHGMRFPDQEYRYDADGNVASMVARNPHGKVLYKIVYSNRGVASFHYDDDRESPKFYNGLSDQPQSFNDGDFNRNSIIASMELKYDDKGRLTERRYLSLTKQPTADPSGAFGESYKYDETGRVTEVTSIDADGKPVSNENGVAITRMSYENGNLLTIEYFTPDNTPATGREGIHRISLEYDDHGNCIRETYFNTDGDASINRDDRAHGYEFTYDDGFRTKITTIGLDGKPAYNARGFVSEALTDNGDGFCATISFLDLNGKPTFGFAEDAGRTIGGYKAQYNATGALTELTFVDDNGETLEDRMGITRTAITRNEVGDPVEINTFNAQDQAAGRGSEASRTAYEYDALGRLVKEECFDKSGKPAADQNNIHRRTRKYNEYGSIEEVASFGTDGKPADDGEGTARGAYAYDAQGRLISVAGYNAAGSLSTALAFPKQEFTYDQSTSHISEVRKYAPSGTLAEIYHRAYSPATGMLTSEWTTLPSGGLKGGTGKVNYVYDTHNNLIALRMTDLAGNPVSAIIDYPAFDVKANAHEVKVIYDDNNLIKELTIWNAGGAPGANTDGIHKCTFTRDERGLPVVVKRYNTSGAPAAGSSDGAELHLKHDNAGQLVETATFDGNGKPAVSSKGFHKNTRDYDSRGNLIETRAYDIDGKPVNTADMLGNSRVVRQYNNRNLCVKESYYNAADTLTSVASYVYNSKGVMTEMKCTDSAGKLKATSEGIAKVTYTTTPDGYVWSKASFYDAAGNLLGTMTWDPATQLWGNPQQAAQAPNPEAAPTAPQDNAWRQQIREISRECPTEISSGVVLRSVVESGNSVVITIVDKNISGNNFSQSEVNRLGNEMATLLRNDLPRSVSVHVRILNREGSAIYNR